MAAKPLIGINTDYRGSRKEHAALSFVAAGYYDGITAAGGIPVILPPLASEDDIVRLLDLLDGVVLVGGADLDPRRDGWMPHPAVRPMDARREDFDRLLAKHVCHVHQYNNAPSVDMDEVFDAQFLRAYIAQAQRHEPFVPQSLTEYITSAYISMRCDEEESATREYFFTTARTLLYLPGRSPVAHFFCPPPPPLSLSPSLPVSC